ncbi:MAG: helix-turn-helix transcriptional regulator [Dehalococcoidia bacterium]
MAKHLGVTAGFVYQVEQGKRKPKDGTLGLWASVYGVRYVDLCKCLNRIPMDLVASLKEEPQPVPADPFSQLTEEEKSELLPFLNFVRWKLKHKSSASQERPYVL